MSEWSVQRRFPRFLVHLMLRYEAPAPSGPGAGVGWVIELSEGGACVELAEPLRPATPLRLSLQTERGALDVQARVVWAGAPDLPGGILHGVAFTHIAPEHLELLRELLYSSGLGRRAGLRLPLALAVTCHRANSAGPPLLGRTGDISREGLLLLLPEVLPPGETLAVTLHTPNEPLRLEGKIVWIEPFELWTPGEPIAHGFQFTSTRWSAPLALALSLASPAEPPPPP